MTIDITKIKPGSAIADAQGLLYGKSDSDKGRILSASEKDIFIQKSLKNALGTVDLLKVQRTAEFLDKIITARELVAFDSEATKLFNELTDAQTSRDEEKKAAYEAINAYNRLFDNTTTYLLEKKAGNDPNRSPKNTVEYYTNLITDANSAINKLAIEKTVKNEEAEIARGEAARWAVAERKSRDNFDKIKTLITRLTTSTNPILVTNPNAPLSVGTNINRYLQDIISILTSNRLTKIPQGMWKTNLGSTYALSGTNSLGWMNKKYATDINRQIFDYFRKIDSDKMIAEINSASHITASNRTTAINIWKELKETDWLIHLVTDTSSIFYNNVQFNEVFARNSNWESRFKGKKVRDIKGAFFNDKKFFEFMRIVFPRAISKEGSQTNSLFTSLDFQEKVDLYVSLFSADHSIGKTRAQFESNDPIIVPELKGAKAADLGLKQVLAFFWDAYHDPVIISDTIGSTTFTSWDLSMDGKEKNNFIATCELEWIKEIRNDIEGFSEEVIPDKDLIACTAEAIMYEALFKIRNSFSLDWFKQSARILGYDKPLHALSGKEFDFDKTKLVDSATDYRSYLNIDSIQLRKDKLELEVFENEAGKKGAYKVISNLARTMGELDLQITTWRKKIAEYETQRNVLGSGTFDELKTRFRAIYGASKIYTLAEVVEIEGLFITLEAKKPVGTILDEDIATAKIAYGTRYALVANDHSRVMSLNSQAKGLKDKLKGLSNSDLEVYKQNFTNLITFRSLTEDEKALEATLLKKLAGTEEEDEVLTLTDLQIKEALNVNIEPDPMVYASWKGLNDANSRLKEKAQITDFIKTNITDKKDDFFKHLKTLTGTDKIDENDNADTAINKFLAKKSAETVIKTIFAHQLETPDTKKTTLQKMAALKLKEANYSKEGGEYTVKAMAQFLFEIETGKPHTLEIIEQPGSPHKVSDDKKWWQKYGYAAIWIPASLIIIGIVAFVFWENITNWWNGGSTEVEGDNGKELE